MENWKRCDISKRIVVYTIGVYSGLNLLII